MTAPRLTIAEVVDILPPPARAAFHHELRRRNDDAIEALTYGVVLPIVVDNLMMRGRA